MGMTLKKAIEIVTGIELTWDDEYAREDKRALKLLIEAGKRLNLWRECGDEVDVSLLPGEDKE